MHGLIGLVGSRSRLFFLLLLTIRTMQVLVGCQSVRYLVENAGSMKDVHFVAFCRLLNIPYDPLDRYIWDLVRYTPFVTRKRNFFWNTVDYEPIDNLQSWTRDDVGPLLSPGGGVIPFAPLLRTRKVLKHGVLHASWTLYQPHALVWDYAFWNGNRQVCRLQSSKIPQLCWEKCVSPPIDNWKTFINALQRGLYPQGSS